MFKLLEALLPFLKELWQGDSDLSKAIRRNKLSAFLFFMNIALAFLLVYMTEQSLTKQVEKNEQTERVVELEKKIAELQKQKPVCRAQAPSVYTPPMRPSRPRPDPAPEPITIHSKLDALRQREDE